MNLVLDQIVGALQELGSDDDDGGCSIAHFLVLLLSELDEDPSSGVLDFDELQDGGAVVGDGDVLFRCRASVGVPRCLICSRASSLQYRRPAKRVVSVELISKPRELLTIILSNP